MDDVAGFVPVIAEEAELAHEETDTECCVLGDSPYGIGVIPEEDEAAHEDDHHGHPVGPTQPSTADSNTIPLMTLSGEMSDWLECANDDGVVFYYHVVTHETTWERPSELPEPPLLSSDRHNLHSDAVETSAMSEGAPLGDGDVQVLVKRVLDGSLRRLDPHTQLQLEEARRRHHEFEELRDAEASILGGDHWVEMYDPTHDGFYYLGLQSGDLRWDRPDSYVMQVESDAVLRMVVRLQCAFRMKLARRKVFLLKLERARMALGGGGGDAEGGGVQGADPWVEVYDPFHKVLYYYCSATGETRWDPPDHFISATEDREMAAAIAIQSMARSHVARRDVKKRKATLRKKQHDLAMEEARRLREIRRKEYSAKTDDERESMCRREMLEEEMDQIRQGDLFWGLDKHDHEVDRQCREETMLADAEAFWQRVNRTLCHRAEMEIQRSHELDAVRRELDVVNEANELDRMRDAEADQCQLGDGFWGIEADEKREERARRDLAHEEEVSRVYGAKVFIEDQFRDWGDEWERRIEEDKIHKVVSEKRNQRQYFQWFYHTCQTADDVLDYLWPGHERFKPRATKDGSGESTRSGQVEDSAQSQTEGPRKPAPYVLDDTVLRTRLETEYRYGIKPILTIHDPSHARVLGRRGQYVVSRIDTDSVFAKAAKKASFKPRSTSPTRPMPQSSKPIPNDTEADEEERIRYGMFPALHYRHAQVPDPHVPARYNGVPFRPSEMVPTRDILMGNHIKHTQLPSLVLPGQATTAPKKVGALQWKKTKQSPFPSPKAKGNKEPKDKRKPSVLQLAMRVSNNDHSTVDPLSSSLGFASPFYRQAQAAREKLLRGKEENRETQQERDARHAHEQTQRERHKFATRFAAEELGAVRAVFVAMDLDGSGTINKTEMVWAMQRDGEVHTLARKSALLRLLLKQQSHLDELFRHLRMSDTQREEISWDVFRVFCEEMYISLMQQGILDASETVVGTAASPTKTPKKEHHTNAPHPRNRFTRRGSVFEEPKEEQLVRRVFALCDQDGNGMLEVEELRQALYTNANTELQQLVRNSKALQPLLHQHTFIDAFRKFEPLDPRGISEEEFVVLCLEIADIAMLNGML